MIEGMVVYHGTAIDANMLGTPRAFSLQPPVRTTYTPSHGLGIFFARYYADAVAYAQAAVMEQVGEVAVVITARLACRNPFKIGVNEFYAITEPMTEDEIASYRAQLLAAGYDSLLIGSTDTGDIAVLTLDAISVQDQQLLTA